MDEKNLHCKEAVCIHTNQVYDSCRDKECLENLRVFLTENGQYIVDRAINVKVKKAEIVWVFSDVETVPFNRGFFTVDLKFFFKLTMEVFGGIECPAVVEGLATFDKKVVLFGSEGKAKIFQSKYGDSCKDPAMWKKTNLPVAVVEVVDPIALSAKLVDTCDKRCCYDDDIDVASIPESVHRVFDEGLVLGGDKKRVFVSLGLFTICKLERTSQLLIPAYDFCIPDKECISATDSNPCDLFEKLKFPVDEFFPPQKKDFDGAEEAFERMRCGE